MLAGQRSVRVGDQLLREIADLLMKKVKDPRVEGVTLTGIRVGRDLKNARIFFSVLGEDEKIMEAEAGLKSAKGFIKREIGFRMELKYIPEIMFKHDPTLKKGNYMEMLLDKLKTDQTADSGH